MLYDYCAECSATLLGAERAKPLCPACADLLRAIRKGRKP